MLLEFIRRQCHGFKNPNDDLVDLFATCFMILKLNREGNLFETERQVRKAITSIRWQTKTTLM
jgi:hypothetical protein